MNGERGSTSLWVLALSLALLAVGGIGLDLWRALADYRALAGVADAAAIAGTSGLDVGHFRDTGEVRLSPDLATELAAELVAAQCGSDGSCPAITTMSVETDDVTVAVELRRPFELTLLRLLSPGSGQLEVVARGHAEASLRP